MFCISEDSFLFLEGCWPSFLFSECCVGPGCHALPLRRIEGTCQSIPEHTREKAWPQNIWVGDTAALMEAVTFADCVIKFSQSELILSCIP